MNIKSAVVGLISAACLFIPGQTLAININTAMPQELSVHLTVPAEQTLLIVEYRLRVGKLYSLDQLYKIEGLQQRVIDRIMQDPDITLEDCLDPRLDPPERPVSRP